MLIEINNKTRSEINKEKIKSITEKFLIKHKKRRNEVSIVFIGDKTITRLNKKYRRINKITDVLAFSGEKEFLGEIIINYAQVRRQAKKYRHSKEEELIYILIHGLLHLLGYNDETEPGRKKMEKLSEEFIRNLK